MHLKELMHQNRKANQLDRLAKELKLSEKYAIKNEENITIIQPIKNDIESAVKNLSLEELMKELASKVD